MEEPVASQPIEPRPGVPGDGEVAWDGPEPEEPTDAELLGLWPDPFAGAPDGEDAWLADLSVPELEVVAARWAAENGAVRDAVVRDAVVRDAVVRDAVVRDAVVRDAVVLDAVVRDAV